MNLDDACVIIQNKYDLNVIHFSTYIITLNDSSP